MACEASSEIPMSVETIKSATPETNPHSSLRKTLPRYLQASTGSCHDHCKFGKTHSFAETKERVPLRTLIKARSAEQRALRASEDSKSAPRSKPRQSKPTRSVSLPQWRRIGKVSESENGGDKAEKLDSEVLHPGRSVEAGVSDDPFRVVDGEASSSKPKRSNPRKRVSVPPKHPIQKVSESEDYVAEKSLEETNKPLKEDSETLSSKPVRSKPRKCVSVPPKHPTRKFAESEDVPEKSLEETNKPLKEDLEALSSKPIRSKPRKCISVPPLRKVSEPSSRGDKAENIDSEDVPEKEDPRTPSSKLKRPKPRKRVSEKKRREDKAGNVGFEEEVPEKTLYVIESTLESITASGEPRADSKAGERRKIKTATNPWKPSSVRNSPRMITSGNNKTKAGQKLSFRRGTVVEPKESDQNSAPRRLKFRRVQHLKTETTESPKSEAKAQRRIVPRSKSAGATQKRNNETRDSEKKRREIVSAAEVGPARVVLRHQGDMGKREVQSLFNNVIEETASKLVEARNSKVKALVGAFETVITSLQDTKPGIA